MDARPVWCASTVLVAEDDSGVRGWASFGRSKDPDANAGTAEVYGMYVDPSSWRAGVGKALWGVACTMLRANFAVATLWVLEANYHGRKFYEECGFVLEPEATDKPSWLGASRVRYRMRFSDAS